MAWNKRFLICLAIDVCCIYSCECSSYRTHSFYRFPSLSPRYPREIQTRRTFVNSFRSDYGQRMWISISSTLMRSQEEHLGSKRWRFSTILRNVSIHFVIFSNMAHANFERVNFRIVLLTFHLNERGN